MDQTSRDLLKTVLNAAQGLKLEKSIYRQEYIVTKTEEDQRKYPKEVIEKMMVDKLASYLYNRIGDMEVEERPDNYRYRLEYLVIKPDNLKDIVEYCIRTMPEWAVNELRLTEPTHYQEPQ